MKPHLLALVLLGSLSMHAQAQLAGPITVQPPTVTARDANSRTWQTRHVTLDPSGVAVTNLGQFVELQTGMHFYSGNEYLESEEKIDLLPGGVGAAALKGPHQVSFSPSAADPVAVTIRLPDGQLLRTRVLGLVYLDTASGQEVLIAEVKDSIGQLMPNGKEVLYPNAFTDFAADIRLTYTKAAFEQEVILRARPPAPEEYGLNSASTLLQVWTEFRQPPTPLEKKVALDQPGGIVTNAPTAALAADDEVLSFSGMTIGRGKAFNVGAEDPAEGVHVRKQWEQREGRQFLIESVPLTPLLSKLEQLPAAPAPKDARLKPKLREALQKRAQNQAVPPAQQPKRPRQMAKAALTPSRPGLVIDYTLINNGTSNLTLRGDATYYVSGNTLLTGVTTLESTVVKFSNTNSAQLKIQGTIKCLTAPYRPAVFTARDDDSVGEPITGSTGNPSGTYAVTALDIDNSNSDLRHLRIAWANKAINYGTASGYPHYLYHSQILNCNQGIVAANSNSFFHVRNALFFNVLTNFNTTTTNVTAHCEHLTVNVASWFNKSTNLTLNLTNSLLVAVTNTGNYSGANNQTYSSSSGVFQTVGAAGHYLADNSPDRNAGTTNLSSQLLADLKTKTTYPPVVLANDFTADTMLYPQAQRDTDLPDRGVHYDPLDYALSWRNISNATVVVTNGAVIGVYGTEPIRLLSGAKLISEGSPANPNRFVRYYACQEQATTNWSLPASTVSAVFWERLTSGTRAQVHCRFTEFPLLYRADQYQWQGGNQMELMSFTDCRFYGGRLSQYGWNPAGSWVIGLTNCLFESMALQLEAEGQLTVYARNNLFRYGSVNAYPGADDTWAWHDNFFESVALEQTGIRIINSHNGYLSTARLYPNATNDVTVSSFTYTNGPLGRYYQVSTNLYNKGSRAADQAGLWHHTVKLDQTKETNSTVDIGFHYVAANPAESEILKSTMTATASSMCSGWYETNAINGSLVDPGWHNCNYAPTNEFLRLDLGSSKTVSAASYAPRQLTTINPPYSGNSNGSFRDGEIYITDVYSSTPSQWGSPVVKARWNWPNGQERRDLEFSPATGRYVYFRRVTAFGWYGPYDPSWPYYGYPPGYASAGEVWVYQRHAATSTAIDSDGDGLPDYFEDRNGNGYLDSGAGETDPLISNTLGSGLAALQVFTPLK